MILSEFAGAAEQLGRGALLINPCDTEGMAEAIYRAYGMTGEERRRRMRRLQRSVRKHDVFWWAEQFYGLPPLPKEAPFKTPKNGSGAVT